MNKKVTPIRNPNHPKKGSKTKAEPIRDLKTIKRIKSQLKKRPRDLCLFTLGINTGYRANELLSITVGEVDHLVAGDRLDIKQSKNQKYRPTTLNATVIEAIDQWLAAHPNSKPDFPLFCSYFNPDEALTVGYLITLVKLWCNNAGLRGRYSSHTLRKTWGYHQRKTFNKPLSLLTWAFAHASERQTLEYLCVQPNEVEELYAEAL